jgi:hypothetical protein
MENLTARTPLEEQEILVLISHSSRDAELASALIGLLRSGLGLLASQIRCSSVDGYRLPAGVNTNDQLRKEIKSVKVLIGLLTSNSLSSTYVLFELGARWGAELFMIPLLAGTRPEDMRGPHAVINALSCETDAQLIQLVEDVARELQVNPQSAASYLNQCQILRALSESIVVAPGTQNSPRGQVSVASGSPGRDFRISFRIQGEQSSQVIKVSANRRVDVSRLDYMLSDETCIISEDCSRGGETFEVPLSEASLTRVFNTPRPDRNFSDHSGPVKFQITASVDGRTRAYIIPARMEVAFHGSTSYRTVIGLKDFYGLE